MQALRFRRSMPRLAVTRLLGGLSRRAFLGPWAPIRFDALPEPTLPRPDWVIVGTRWAGICGSDTKQVWLHGALDNPMTAVISFPHVLGHEAVGTIEAVGPEVRTRRVGERIVLNPWLSCLPRGVDPPCSACLAGDVVHCRSFTGGCLPPGIHLGNNARAPGAFAPRFAAHESQCVPVPEAIPDTVAVLADPFSVALRAVLRNPPPADAPALVFGAGTIGLLAVAILRRLYPALPLYAVARYPHQAERARALGATDVLPTKPRALVAEMARLTGTRPRQPWRGLPWLLDGAGIAYDTVASAQTLETAVRIVRPGASVVAIGVETPHRFEWTPLYFKEIRLVGSNAFALETFQGRPRHAMEIFLEMAGEGLDLSGIVTHRYPLAAWRRGFLALAHKRRSGAIKVILGDGGEVEG